MLIHNANVTGSLTLNGIDIGDITGSEVSIGALNSFSSSINIYTGSNNTNINALQTFSSSILTYTASNDSINTTQNNRLSSLETTSGSLINASSSFSTRVTSLESFSSSLDSTFATDAELTSLSSSVTGRLTTDENTITNNSSSFASRLTTDESNISSLQTASGSFSTRTTNLETASGSFSTRVTSNESNITSLNSKTGSYATTGSNTFVNTQYISAANNPVSFTSTASFYTDGGVRVAKDLYVSGTSYFNNVTVFGTQSVQYITSSQLNISTNIISVNTDTPTIRFGGLAVYDSGSTGLTGSMLWDSENNHWVYTNPSGSSYSGGMLISGPRSSALGSEQGTTFNALMKGQGGDHITSSGIFESGSGNVGIGTSTPITNLHIVNNTNVGLRLQATAANGSSELDLLSHGTQNAFLDYGPNQLRFRSTNSDMSAIVSGSVLVLNNNGNVGIGTESPSQKLTVFGSTLLSGSSVNLNFDSPGLGNGDISFNGSTFTIVSNSSSAPLVLSTNSTERMRITSGGNVGIGATSPSFRLDVNGQGRFYTNSDSVVDILMLYNISSTSAGVRQRFQNGYGDLAAIKVSQRDNGSLADDGIMEFQVASNTSLDTKMSILNTGNVGIGTTSPGKILNVAVNDSTAGNYQARNAVVRIQNTNDSAANSRFAGVQFSFSPGASTGDNYVIGAIGAVLTDSSTQWSGDLVFAAKSATTVTTLTEYMRIATGGNVGIGNTSPSYKLDVSGTGRFSTELRITDVPASEYAIKTVSADWANGSTIFTGIKIGAAADTFAAGIDLRAISNYASTAGTQFAIAVNSVGNTMTEVLRIDAAGNVGVGTTSPDAIFHVAKSNTGGIGGQIVIDNNASSTLGNTAEISFITDAGASGAGTRNARILAVNDNASNGAANMQFHTWNGSASAERMRISNSGNIGIGTATPRTKAEFSSGLPTSIPTRTNTTNGIAVTDGGAIYGRIGVADLSAGGVGYPTYIQAGDWDGASYYNILLNPLGGNVGIGTTSPGYRFQSNGPSGDWSGYFKGSSTSNNSYGLFIDAGTSSSDSPFMVRSADGLTTFLRILGNGNVGIGTTDPSGYRLKVQNTGTTGISIQTVGSDSGNPQLQMLNGATDTTIAATSNGLELTAYSSHALLLKTVNVERMRITTDGNVGIGTTSPDRRLTVYSTDDTRGILIQNTSTTSYSELHFIANRQYRIGTGGSSSDSAAANNWYVFDATAEAHRFTINSSGSVGIGTTSPTAKLHISSVSVNPASAAIQSDSKLVVAGTDGNMDLLSQDDNSTVSNAIGMGRYNASTGALIHKFGIVTWANSGNQGSNAGDRIGFHYGTNTDTWNSTELMTIKVGGNVGLGTTSPSSRLHVSGSGGRLVRVEGPSNTDNYISVFSGGIEMFLDADVTNSSGIVGTQSGHNLILRTNGDNRVWVTTSGNMGIGTSSPSTKLEVNGTITETSSIRYKENIETIKYGLDKILQMRGVTYDRKDSGLKEVGVIAEEINEIFPDLVVKNEEGLVESVSYGRFTALLIEAIKELKIEIEELKANR